MHLRLVYKFSFNSFCFLLTMFLCFSHGFADKNAVVPNFNLVNQTSLDKILKAEVLVHSDNQLKVAHLITAPILEGTLTTGPISNSQVTTIPPKGFAIKLEFVVRDECMRDPKPSDNVFPNKSFGIHILDICQWFNFNPLGKVIRAN